MINAHTIDTNSVKGIIEKTKVYLTNPSKDIRTLTHDFYIKLYNVGGKDVKSLLETSKDTAVKNTISEVYKPQKQPEDEIKKLSPPKIEGKKSTSPSANLNRDKIKSISESKKETKKMTIFKKSPKAKEMNRLITHLVKDEEANLPKEDAKNIRDLKLARKGFTLNEKERSGVKIQKPINRSPILTNAITRIDLLSLIPQELLNNIADPDAEIRCDAKNHLESIINEVNHISSIGLSPLMNILKEHINDKLLGKGFIKIIGKLVNAMGCGAKQYAKSIIPKLVIGLKDRGLRIEIIKTINEFSKSSGNSLIMNMLIQLSDKENQDSQHELLLWILKHNKDLNKSNSIMLLKNFDSYSKEFSKDIEILIKKLIVVMLPIIGKDEINGIELNKINNIIQEFLSLDNIEDIEVPGLTSKIIITEEATMEDLRMKCENTVNPKLGKLIFDNDIEEGIKVLRRAIYYDKPMNNVLDIILKWIIIQLYKKCDGIIDLLLEVSYFLVIHEYVMTDFEAVLMFGGLTEIINNYDDENIIKAACTLSRIYPGEKLWKLLFSILNDKNNKGCLILLNKIVEDNELIEFNNINLIGNILCDEKFKELKTYCIELLSSIFKIIGDSIWKELESLPKEFKSELCEVFFDISTANNFLYDKKSSITRKSLYLPNTDLRLTTQEESKMKPFNSNMFHAEKRMGTANNPNGHQNIDKSRTPFIGKKSKVVELLTQRARKMAQLTPRYNTNVLNWNKTDKQAINLIHKKK